jgi:hypothetical protein
MPLADEIRLYANLSHANAWRTLKAGKKMLEQTLVSSFLSPHIIAGIRETLRKYTTAGTRTLTRGIFTHQTPWVHMDGASNASEVADLMLVHRHFTPRFRTVKDNALLLQAKRSCQPTTGPLTSSGDKIQFTLYQKWTRFNGVTRLPHEPFVGAGFWDFNSAPFGPALNGSGYLTVFSQRAFNMVLPTTVPPTKTQWWKSSLVPAPKTTFNRGKYPLDCTWSCGSSPLSGAVAASGVHCPNDFGATLSDFLSGHIGRNFVSGGTDHWSKFVDQMLVESASKEYSFTMNNAELTSGLRGRNLGLVTTMAHCLALETEVPDERHWALRFADDLETMAENGDIEFPPSENTEEHIRLFGGHVPILLILTMGDELSPFMVEGVKNH